MRDNILFTVITDYAGITDVRQVSASTPDSALKVWIDRFARADKSFGLKERDLWHLVEGGDFVQVQDCNGVWCTSTHADKGLLLINIVATRSDWSGVP
jgi:hypothetical protein